MSKIGQHVGLNCSTVLLWTSPPLLSDRTVLPHISGAFFLAWCDRCFTTVWMRLYSLSGLTSTAKGLVALGIVRQALPLAGDVCVHVTKAAPAAFHCTACVNFFCWYFPWQLSCLCTFHRRHFYLYPSITYLPPPVTSFSYLGREKSFGL